MWSVFLRGVIIFLASHILQLEFLQGCNQGTHQHESAYVAFWRKPDQGGKNHFQCEVSQHQH